jgi:hypothetical protein
MAQVPAIRPRAQRFALLAIDRESKKIVAAGFSDRRRVLDYTQGQLVQVALEQGQGQTSQEAQDDCEKYLRQRGILEWFNALCAPNARESSLAGFGAK